jgi:RNA polymerase sigma factor (sigma-70 family)
MADRSLNSSIRGVLRRLKAKEVKRLPDAELVDRYVRSRDEAAFTALVSRHGPTVLSVCRRVLRAADVDDAFQATFLALARQAGMIRRQEAVGAWLYEVAYHIALRAKARRARSQKVEQAAATAESTTPTDQAVANDIQQVLDEELHRLPERLRQPLVLVHLMGHVQVDAARELGITDRTLRRRLLTAREQLRERLSRRGVALTTVALTAVLDLPATAGPVPPNLVRPTVQSVLAYAAGQTGALPAGTASLAMAGVGGWLAGRFKLASLLAAVSTAAALAFTASALTPAGPSASIPPASPPAPPVANVEVADGRTQVLTGRVLDAEGRPLAHATVTALVRRPWQPNDRGLQDQEVARATADAAGRYRLVVPNDFPTHYSERQVTLLAHSAGHAPITTNIVLRGRPSDVTLRLTNSAVTEGRLLDPEGRPAANVRLAVVRLGRMTREITQGEDPTPAPPGWPADTITDLDGRFRMQGLSADDSPWLQVQDDRFALTTFALPVGAADPLSVTLAEPRLLVARVIAADTRQPLAGARISVCAGILPSRSGRYTALASSPDAAALAPACELTGRADAEGRIRLRLPPGNLHDVHVYPPDGVAYVERPWKLEWTNGELSQERTFALVRGTEVRGEVAEEDGRPIVGACVYFAVRFPRSITSPIGGDTVPFGAMARFTGADGRFRIVVPPLPCHLEVIGPSADYRPQTFEYEACHYCDDGHLARIMEHAFVALHYTCHDRPEPLRLTLRRGTPVTGRAVGPSGEAIQKGVLVSRSATQPLRSGVPRALSIRDGVFELPGCVPERTYPVLLLDPVRRLGAVTELHVPAAGESPPTVRLAECGTAKVRLVDAVGRPLAGQQALVRALLDYDRPSVEPAAPVTRPRWAPVAASWIDTTNYLSAPMTDADGTAILPALVPGLKYYVEFVIDGRWVSRTNPFPVAPGETVRLPDVVIDVDGNAGHAGGVP